MQRVQRAEGARLRVGLRDPHRRARLGHPADGLRLAHRADQARHRRDADLSRTPVATAQSFATLDEFSGGRAVAGLGCSHRPVVEAWYGQTIDKPSARDARVRGICARSSPVRTRRRREVPPRLPLHGLRAAAIRPADLPGRPLPGMLRLAGEIADGVILWLCNPHYIRDVVRARRARGPREGRQGARGLRHRGRRALRRVGDARPAASAALGARALLLLPFYRATSSALRVRP